jgi:23S rRNA (guanosine2251-2'-O)-methyltransferase
MKAASLCGRDKELTTVHAADQAMSFDVYSSNRRCARREVADLAQNIGAIGVRRRQLRRKRWGAVELAGGKDAAHDGTKSLRAGRLSGRKQSRPPHRGPGWQRRTDGAGPVILYGWHSVTAALTNPARRIRRLLATENALRRLAEDGITLPVEPELVRPDALAARLTPDAVHQGLLAEADPLPSPDIEDLPETGVVLVLDQITDPHNVGAILRTAAAFAVDAIVTTARHSPEATGVLAKSASGALELVPLVLVQNLARALTELKERGFLVVGLDSAAPDDLSALELRTPLALVLGAEGKGLRQLTGETCDRLARLDLPGAIKSLNVSNAAALSLYIASRAIAPGG